MTRTLNSAPEGSVLSITGVIRNGYFYPEGGLNIARFSIQEGPWSLIEVEVLDHPVGSVVRDSVGDYFVRSHPDIDGWRMIAKSTGVPVSTPWTLKEINDQDGAAELVLRGIGL